MTQQRRMALIAVRVSRCVSQRSAWCDRHVCELAWSILRRGCRTSAHLDATPHQTTSPVPERVTVERRALQERATGPRSPSNPHGEATGSNRPYTGGGERFTNVAARGGEQQPGKCAVRKTGRVLHAAARHRTRAEALPRRRRSTATAVAGSHSVTGPVRRTSGCLIARTPTAAAGGNGEGPPANGGPSRTASQWRFRL